MRRIYAFTAVVGIVVVGLGVWLERRQLLAWYFVYQLNRANPEDRVVWMARLTELDDSAIPSLMSCLRQNDDQACNNAAAALQTLVERWDLDDPRTYSLSARVAGDFPAMSASGQENILRMERAWLENHGKQFHGGPPLLSNICRLLSEAATISAPAVRHEALTLTTVLIERRTVGKAPADSVLINACQLLARAGLADSLEDSRLLAVQLAQRSEIHLLAEVVPLLRDRSAAVRRAAMLALGPAPEVISDDHLLYWLTDPDADVRQLCEMALRGRGLQENHIRMARLIADPRPAVRLRVIDKLTEAADLDATAWLRRLSHDPAPAVRAAAIRAAASTQESLVDRIEQVAQNDPSPTVQQVARYYLSCQNLGVSKRPNPSNP